MLVKVLRIVEVSILEPLQTDNYSSNISLLIRDEIIGQHLIVEFCLSDNIQCQHSLVPTILCRQYCYILLSCNITLIRYGVELLLRQPHLDMYYIDVSNLLIPIYSFIYIKKKYILFVKKYI